MCDAQDLTSIILAGRLGSVVVRELLVHLRLRDPKRETLGHLASELGMPSRGYVADILSGRRKITERYKARVLEYLQLGRFERDIVELMLDAEACRDATERRKMLGTVNDYKKLVRAAAANKASPSSNSNSPSSLEGAIVASFDLFDGSPSREDLHRLFANRGQRAVDLALESLLAKGLVVLEDERFSAYQTIVFVDPLDSKNDQISFLKGSIDDASQNIERWFSNPGESCFQSFYLSAKSSEYLMAVQDIKRFIYERLSSLESKEADCLAQVNVKMFPHALQIKQ